MKEPIVTTVGRCVMIGIYVGIVVFFIAKALEYYGIL